MRNFHRYNFTTYFLLEIVHGWKNPAKSEIIVFNDEIVTAEKFHKCSGSSKEGDDGISILEILL